MTITLPVAKRDDATKTKELRANGSVPAVVYGPKQEPIQIAVDAKAFDKIRHEAGESTIIELSGLDETIEVLIKSVDFNAVRQEIDHVDLYAIERGKDMTATVPLNYSGESPAEQNRIGVVNKVLYEVEVTCRPSSLPSHIDVDLTTLVTLEDKILVKDLKVEEGVVLSLEEEEPVVVVNAVQEEKEEEVGSVDMDAIEVEAKGKEESDTADAEEKPE